MSLVRLPGVGKPPNVWSLKCAINSQIDVVQPPENRCWAHRRHQTLQDAISALVSLGYKHQEANRTVTKIDDGAASSEELIRRALREMM